MQPKEYAFSALNQTKIKARQLIFLHIFYQLVKQQR